MSSRRSKIGVGLAVALATLLAGCTPGYDWGMRLNSDDTVDFVVCDSLAEAVEVNYHRNNEPAGVVEWMASAPGAAQRSAVVQYGDQGYLSAVLLPPPDDWEWVTANQIWVERGDLEVGMWVWSTADFPFVPGRPCAGVTESELEG